MNVRGILLYVAERYKQDTLIKSEQTYNSDMLYTVTQMMFKMVNGKTSNDLKSWSEICEKLKKYESKTDVRTDEQVEKDTIDLYNEYFLKKD